MGMEFKTIHDKIAQITTLSPCVDSSARKIIEASSWTLQRQEFQICKKEFGWCI